jgi:hypothetical protein
MKLLSLKQTAIRGTDEVFGATWVGGAIACVLMSALTIGAFYMVIVGQVRSFDPPRILSGFIGLFFLLFAWVSFRTAQAARRPTNWILRIRGSELLIKFRSFENWRMSEDDVQVIELNRDEIASVGKSTERQVTSNMERSGVQAQSRVELIVELKEKNTAELEEALAAERTRPGWGSDRSRTKALDYPVQADNGIIRVVWKSNSASIKPGIDVALARLGKVAPLAEAQVREGDFTTSALGKLSEEEQKQKLTELARRDRMAAMWTAQQLYKCSLAEAKERIESFM